MVLSPLSEWTLESYISISQKLAEPESRTGPKYEVEGHHLGHRDFFR